MTPHRMSTDPCCPWFQSDANCVLNDYGLVHELVVDVGTRTWEMLVVLQDLGAATIWESVCKPAVEKRGGETLQSNLFSSHLSHSIPAPTTPYQTYHLCSLQGSRIIGLLTRAPRTTSRRSLATTPSRRRTRRAAHRIASFHRLGRLSWSARTARST